MSQQVAEEAARAEDKVRNHLPREVVRLQGWLDQQHDSFDFLHGETSKLTEIVMQMSISVGKKACP